MGGWSGQTFVVKNSTFVVKDQKFPDFFTGFVRFLNTLDGVFRMEIVFFRACGARQVPNPPRSQSPQCSTQQSERSQLRCTHLRAFGSSFRHENIGLNPDLWQKNAL